MPLANRNNSTVLEKVGKTVLFFFVFAVGIPLILGLFSGVPPPKILSFVVSIFVLHAWASPIGYTLGLGTTSIAIIMGCVALALSFAIFEICEGLALSSEWVRERIEHMGKITGKYPRVQKFGPVACTFIVWIPGIGLYGAPVIAWIFRWKRAPSIIFTAIGFIIAALLVLFTANRFAFG